MTLNNPFNMPGMGDALETTEREFTWNEGQKLLFGSGVIVSTTTDASNTPTTQLRKGLLLAKNTSTGKLGVYTPGSATLGQVYGILALPVNMLDRNGSAQDVWGQVILGGPVRASQLLLLDYTARAQMRNRFIFDDDLTGVGNGVRQMLAKTADYTVVAADNGTFFTTQGTSGAVNFTLPALADVSPGWTAEFYNEANQNMVITAPADKLVVFNDLTATSITFSTAGELIGAHVKIRLNADGTKYLASFLTQEAVTPTIA